jgi:hypothetical protein
MALSACGGGEVVVQAQLEREGGEPTPLRELEIRALPYDRDVIFDSLRAAYPEPEPAIPDSLMQLQARIASLQRTWNEAESRWNTARDSLTKLNAALRALPRNSPRYRLMFADFGQQESREAAAKRQSDQAFAEFTRMQSGFARQAEELRARRDMWGDEAFAAVDSVIALRIDALGREEARDTTDASGIARVTGLKPGQWWIYAWYDLPYEELYWNIPVEVARGEPTQIILNRASAEIRPKI